MVMFKPLNVCCKSVHSWFAQLVSVRHAELQYMWGNLQIFHKPLLDCELLTEKEVAMIFVNWKELIMCNIKLLK